MQHSDATEQHLVRDTLTSCPNILGLQFFLLAEQSGAHLLHVVIKHLAGNKDVTLVMLLALIIDLRESFIRTFELVQHLGEAFPASDQVVVAHDVVIGGELDVNYACGSSGMSWCTCH